MTTIVVMSSTGPFEIAIDKRGQIVSDIETTYQYEVAYTAMGGSGKSQLAVFYETWNSIGGIPALLNLLGYMRRGVVAAADAIDDIAGVAPKRFWRTSLRPVVDRAVRVGYLLGTNKDKDIEDLGNFVVELDTIPRIYEGSSDARLNIFNAAKLLLTVVSSVLYCIPPESGEKLGSELWKIFDFSSAAKACFVAGPRSDTRSDEWCEAQATWEDHQVARLAGIVHSFQTGPLLKM